MGLQCIRKGFIWRGTPNLLECQLRNFVTIGITGEICICTLRRSQHTVLLIYVEHGFYIAQKLAKMQGPSVSSKVTKDKSQQSPSSTGPITPLLPFVTACWEPCLCWLHICLSILIFHFLFPLLVVVIESVTFSIFWAMRLSFCQDYREARLFIYPHLSYPSCLPASCAASRSVLWIEDVLFQLSYRTHTNITNGLYIFYPIFQYG